MEQGGEERLVREAVRGSVQAYGELIQRHKNYFYKIAYTHCGNEQDALDIVQESIVKGYRSIRSLRKEQYFSTWMTRILINTARDLVKKRRWGPDWDQLADKEQAEGEDWEARMDVRQAVEQLPEKYRTAVTLRFYEDLPVGEIARRMQVPPATVSTYLSRAIQLLKKKLQKEYGRESGI